VAKIFHITDRVTWREAARVGEYRMSTRGVTLEDQGFIHCSLGHQLSAVAALVYSDLDDDELIVLVIDSSRVSAPVRYEAAEPDGVEYPHIYGALPVSAVTGTIAISRDAAGQLVLPADAGPDNRRLDRPLN
jgi:uncharacterized protein (DUF952 family)